MKSVYMMSSELGLIMMSSKSGKPNNDKHHLTSIMTGESGENFMTLE